MDAKKYNNFIKEIATECLKLNDGKKIHHSVYITNEAAIYYKMGEIIRLYINQRDLVGDTNFFFNHINNRTISVPMFNNTSSIDSIMDICIERGIKQDVEDLIIC